METADKVETVQLNVAIDKELDKALAKYCIDNEIKKKEVVAMAIEAYLKARQQN